MSCLSRGALSSRSRCPSRAARAAHAAGSSAPSRSSRQRSTRHEISNALCAAPSTSISVQPSAAAYFAATTAAAASAAVAS
eukprot:4010177-Prymnesium_polylepis.1